MIKKLLVTATLAVLSIAGYAADLIGAWNIRNFNDMGKGSKQANLMFGILGESKSIQFKNDGTFFCNDTIYGTYTSKDNELVLVRDKKLVEAYKAKLANGTEVKNELINGYDCDSLKLTFTKEGNKALVEINEGEEERKQYWSHLLPFGIIFEISKQGTDGKNEDLNAGKSISGKYSLNIIGMVNMTFDFKENGQVGIEASGLGKSEKVDGKYSINGKIMTIEGNGKEMMKGEYVIGTNCFYIMVKKDKKIIAMAFWKE